MEQLLGLPPDGSAHGPAIDNLIVVMHWLMFILFFGWGIFYIITLIRFRQSRHPKANYAGVKSHFSTMIEVGVAIFEVVLLVGFSIPLWSKRVDAFPAEKDATVVHVVAEQFAWNIHYPGPDGVFGRTMLSLVDSDNPLGLDRSDPNAADDITTINQLNVPADKPVLVYLSSKDVIHSFSLPAYRVKQDAVPGMRIPVWFTPVMTTDSIGKQMRTTFSIAEAARRVRRLRLPEPSASAVRAGGSMDDRMVMQDYQSSTGEMIAAKGDHLTEDVMDRLAQSGMSEVASRPAAQLDRYIATEDMKDASGTMVVAKNEPLSEDAVTKLIEAGMKEIPARPVSNMDSFVLVSAVTDNTGAIVASPGDALSEDVITKLGESGVMAVVVAPSTPTEIACAQLCGLGHFRMRGYITVQTPGQYSQWVDEQEAALKEQAAPASDAAPADSSANP